MPKHTSIYQEMGETTQAQITYVVAYGGKLYLTTNLNLNGRGIRKEGQNNFLVTKLAFKKLQKIYDTCYLALLKNARDFFLSRSGDNINLQKT